MKVLRLRTRYFGWLALIVSVMFCAFVLLLVGFNFFEYRQHNELGEEELLEALVLIGITAAIVPGILALAWRVSGRLLLPLQDMLASANRIRGGDLDHRIPVLEPEDELGQLAETINGAFGRYKEAAMKLEQFSSDVSHQIRNPLASIRSAGQVALQRARTPEEYQSVLGEVLEEIDRMERVIEQLLKLARLSDEAVRSSFESFDAAGLATEVVEELRELFSEKGLALELVLPSEAGLRGSPLLLKEALSNLLHNALNYTPTPGRVRLTLTAEPQHAAFLVEDSGPGIPSPMAERIFERFRRGDTEAVFSDGGHGLGLAIVRRIVVLHGGELSLTDSAFGGAGFVLRLPRSLSVD